MISINLAELGINMLPRPKKPSELEKLIHEGEFQAALRYFIYDPLLPAQAIREFYLTELKSENGYRNFDNRVINSAISRSAEAYSSQEISRILQQMQVQINQLSPCIFLFFEDQIIYAINTRFRNTSNTEFQELEFVLKIYPKNEWYVPVQNQKY
jgi:ABC-type transport system substrate-binding protein